MIRSAVSCTVCKDTGSALFSGVWSRICRHMDGLAVGSTLLALHEHGVLGLLSTHPGISAGEIGRRCGGNPGYLHVALRLLECQGWLNRDGASGSGEMTCSLTALGKECIPLAPFYGPAVSFLAVARDLETELASPGGGPATRELRRANGRICRRWDLPSSVSHSARLQVLHHLNGHVLAPIMAVLSLRGILSTLQKSGPLPVPQLARNADALNAAFRAMSVQGWLKIEGGSAALTASGKIAAACARQYWYPMAYLETLRRTGELLFGDASQLRCTDPSGNETHIDRKLDVQFSGKIFSGKCRRLFLEAARPIFDRTPLHLQPEAIVDTGCGDGGVLRALYEDMRTHTMRGRNLNEYPLAVFGIEPSPVARQAAAAALSAAGISGTIIDGDVSYPAAIAHSLAAHGIDACNSLHVSKSVFHNRRFIPQGREALSVPSFGAYALADGTAIQARDIAADLAGHFSQWRAFAARHGLLIIEAHTTTPETAFSLMGQTIATLIDATHGYSNQYPVDPEVFLAAAKAAGFESRCHHELGRDVAGHTVLTIDHFVAG